MRDLSYKARMSDVTVDALAATPLGLCVSRLCSLAHIAIKTVVFKNEGAGLEK